jgi:hypothetical protein
MKPCRKHDGGSLGRAIEWLIDDGIFAGHKRHGNMNWSLRWLATMALLWSWGDEEGLRERFEAGLEVLKHLDPREKCGRTYQGFIRILAKWSDRLRAILVARLRERMRSIAGACWTVQGWTVMAVDGTRVEAPRTDDNLRHFKRCAAHGQRKRKSSRRSQREPASPQVWLTVMWHVGLGLLWDWRQGPTGSSERAHLSEMIEALPPRSLVVADAGFSGYEYWAKLLENGHSFVIRVAGQVRLLRGLGFVRRRRNIVYLWPDKARRRRELPIALRLLEFHDGRRSMWLATNILDPKQLTPRAMREIYRLRWEVEVFIRGFKRTFGRGKLRSHAPRNVEVELDWSLLALWSLELLAVRELIVRDEPPTDLSLAGALRAMHTCLHCAIVGVEFDLCSRLPAHRHDGYTRERQTIREWPRKKSADAIGPPIIRTATKTEVSSAHELQQQAA